MKPRRLFFLQGTKGEGAFKFEASSSPPLPRSFEDSFDKGEEWKKSVLPLLLLKVLPHFRLSLFSALKKVPKERNRKGKSRSRSEVGASVSASWRGGLWLKQGLSLSPSDLEEESEQ